MDAEYARRPSCAAIFNGKYTLGIRHASKMRCDKVKLVGGGGVFDAQAILLRQRSSNRQAEHCSPGSVS